MIKILWQFETATGYVWLEWVKDNVTRIRRYTQKQYEDFMAENFSCNQELDFLE